MEGFDIRISFWPIGYRFSRSIMSDFNRKMDETASRVNKGVANAAERLEKESSDFIQYLNNEVVPAVRNGSTKALRTAAQKLHQLADFMDESKKS